MRRSIAALALLVFALFATSCHRSSDNGGGGGGKLKMGMLPKLVGIPYFTAAEKGAREAADELDIDLDYDGPTVDSAEDQDKTIRRWIAQGYGAIAIAPNDPEFVAPALKKAKEAGIVVLTWDADANPAASGRQTFVNQAPVEAIGNTLVDLLGEAVGGKGKVVIVTGSITSPNQNAWIKVMKARLAEKYPKLELLETVEGNEDQAQAYNRTTSLLNAHDDLAGVWGITSVALPAAAKAVRDAGRSGQVAVTGLSLPNLMREYVKDGTVKQFVLWNPVDLGYLTVHAAHLLHQKKLTPGKHDFGRLKGIEVSKDEVLLGAPLIFDRENIDEFDF